MLSSLLVPAAVKTIEANLLTCQHCGHSWISQRIPKRCSRCRSKNWQRLPRFQGNTSKRNEHYLPQRQAARRRANYHPHKEQEQDEARRMEAIRTMYPPKPGQRIACLYYPDLEGRTLYQREERKD